MQVASKRIKTEKSEEKPGNNMQILVCVIIIINNTIQEMDGSGNKTELDIKATTDDTRSGIYSHDNI